MPEQSVAIRTFVRIATLMLEAFSTAKCLTQHAYGDKPIVDFILLLLATCLYVLLASVLNIVFLCVFAWLLACLPVCLLTLCRAWQLACALTCLIVRSFACLLVCCSFGCSWPCSFWYVFVCFESYICTCTCLHVSGSLMDQPVTRIHCLWISPGVSMQTWLPQVS